MDCAVCLERFNTNIHKPMVLQCGHTFCITCIHNIYARTRPECPIDRAQLTQPISEVRINYTVQDIISSFSSFSISNPVSQPTQNPPSIIYPSVPSFIPENFNSINTDPAHDIVKCPNNHNLIEISENTSNFTNRIKLKVICNFCRTGDLNKTWSCLPCNFDLCENCIDDQVFCEPLLSDSQILCENSHALYYFKNSDLFYTRKMRTESLVSCNFCQKSWKGGSWACRLCQFDLCNECVDRSQLAINLQCNKSHLLHVYKQDLNKGNKFVCTVCKIVNQGKAYCCKPCKFIMCEACSEYFTKSVYLPITCPDGHSLVNSNEQVGLYFIRTSTKTYTCNSCMKKIDVPVNFHCRRCDFDLCYECYETIAQGMNMGIIRKCKNNHELSWYYDTCKFYKMNMRCDLCKKAYPNSGSFHCRLCKFDVCLVCCRSLIKR